MTESITGIVGALVTTILLFLCLCVCRCDCVSGYTGKNCSENIDDCASHICQNAATCEDGVNSYRCVCSRGYAGRFCEIAPVPGAVEYYYGGVCENHDCKNGGLCIQPPGSPEYICKCPPGNVLSLLSCVLRGAGG